MQNKSAIKAANLIFEEVFPCESRVAMRSPVPGMEAAGMICMSPIPGCWLRVVRGAQAVAGETGWEKVPVPMLTGTQRGKQAAELKRRAEDSAGPKMIQRL